jgi:hypothetical protein
MRNLNLVEAFMNQFLVVDLRLRGEHVAPQDDEKPKTFSHALFGLEARE